MDEYSRKEKLRIDVLNTTEEREHFHQDIELLYVLEGKMDVTIGEQVTHMEREDILVINANKKHKISASQDILFARLFITYQLVSDIFQSVDIIFWCDSTKEDSARYDELRSVLKNLLNHFLSTRGGVANFGHIALCYQVMDILSVHFLVQATDKENMNEKDRFEDRILQINNYMRANYNQPISLKDLSEKLFLSHGYLSRFFKKNYGMSFAEYLSNIRLYHAVDELLYTNTPITRIAYDNGFASVAVFNKAFKNAYGDTPSAVRKRSREQKEEQEKDENDILIEERLEKFLREDGLKREEESSSKGVIKGSCSVKTREATAFIWRRMINIGSASDLLKSEVREHVILLREALKFQYVRFWNLFSKEMLVDFAGEYKEYNFTKVDSILDFLLNQGLKPHIELGRKPKRIYKNVQEALVFHQEVESPATLHQWRELMKALMRHLIHRYGRHEVDTWRMELWMDENQWGKENAQEEYFALFSTIYEVVRGYSENIAIGGCGLRVGYVEQSEQDFLKKWNQQPHRPDFLSILYYAYERGEINQDRYSRRKTDNEGMLHCIQNVREIMAGANMQDLPLYITEWNLTISDRNYINDTCFKGAYVVKNVLDIYGMVDEISYFPGSDRVSEYFDSNLMLHGGMGVISKDGILKPAGFAFEFLNRLYRCFVGKDKNYLISTDGHDSYGIVCHNQKSLNYNYYFTKEDQVEKENIWKYFEDRETLEIKLCLCDVEDGMYQVKSYRINENNGSVLNIWAEMEYESELSRNDIKYFRRVCEPKLKIQKLEAKEHKLNLELILAPNEIGFVRIRRLI